MRTDLKWSKLKKIVESRFCDKLKKRIQINLTHYRSIHEPESRFWITYDGKEIISISKLQWLNEWTNIRQDYDGDENKSDYAAKILRSEGKVYIDEIIDSIEEYVNLSIDDALISQNFITKALAMIDGRTGKRRLISMVLDENDHQLVKDLYKIRCEVEKIKSME